MILTKTSVLRLFGSSLHYPAKVEVLKFEKSFVLAISVLVQHGDAQGLQDPRPVKSIQLLVTPIFREDPVNKENI